MKPTRIINVNGQSIPVYGNLSDDAKKRIVQTIEKRIEKMEYEKVTLSNVRQFERQFFATVTIEDEILKTVKTYQVETNKHGNGFWIDGQQKTGTSQFSVNSLRSWRRKLHEWFG